VPETVQEAIDRVLVAYDQLAELGSSIDDEWSYINDLTDTWRARLSEVGDRRGTEFVAPEIETALDRAVAEIELIRDPHRAIDWLSTFPQVVLLAIGEPS
jgi:hypothetical protein